MLQGRFLFTKNLWKNMSLYLEILNECETKILWHIVGNFDDDISVAAVWIHADS